MQRRMFGEKKYHKSLQKQVQKKHPGGWSTDHWQAAKFKKDHCEACGSMDNLIAHHIDQEPKHNTVDNVQTLCKKCHDFWHNAADRTGRKVAGRMPLLYPDTK